MFYYYKKKAVNPMKLIPAISWRHWFKIYCLYRKAFPKYERKPFKVIVNTHKRGNADVWYIKNGNKFAGLAITLNTKDLVLLDYFAIDSRLRGQGLGSKSLKALFRTYVNQRFFLEIESVFDPCDNLDERLRRKHFYLQNGMTEMKIMVNLFGTKMEVLGHNCQLTYEEYSSVYANNYVPDFTKNVQQVPYPNQ